MGYYLDWATDGADWPNRQASRFVEAAGMRWHVQVMGEAPPCCCFTAPVRQRIPGAT